MPRVVKEAGLSTAEVRPNQAEKSSRAAETPRSALRLSAGEERRSQWHRRHYFAIIEAHRSWIETTGVERCRTRCSQWLVSDFALAARRVQTRSIVRDRAPETRT